MASPVAPWPCGTMAATSSPLPPTARSRSRCRLPMAATTRSSSRRSPRARPARSRTVPARPMATSGTWPWPASPIPSRGGRCRPIYSTGKAVNYSPYRTAGGPITSEVPSDAEILQDLTLLDLAGFDLLRLFGARAPATDVVAEKILRIAAQNFPEMKFQLGVELKGLTSCSQTDNDYNIAYLISNLSKYPNVVTISVGNETSFFSRYMPLPCLEGYIRTIRSQVAQPVTADDDWTFYAGKSTCDDQRTCPGQAGHDPGLDRFRLHSHVSVQLHGLGLEAGRRRRGAGPRTGHDGDVARRPEGVVRGRRQVPVRRRGRRHGERRRLDAHHRRRDRLEGPPDQPCGGDRVLRGAAGERQVVLRPAVREPRQRIRPGRDRPAARPRFSTSRPSTRPGRESTTAGACGTSRARRATPCAACRRARPATPTCTRARATTIRLRSARLPSTRPMSITHSWVSRVPRTPRCRPTRRAAPTGWPASRDRRRPP